MRRPFAGSLIAALLLAVAGWTVPSPAGAVATPWTWLFATGSGVSTSAGTVVTATCPDGYRAMAGGVNPGTAIIKWETMNGPDYSVYAYIVSGSIVTVSVWCALSSQVDVHLVDRNLITDQPYGSVGRALGDFACEGNMTPLSASLTWNEGGNRVLQSGPETSGGTNMWFVDAGGNSTSDSMHVQLLCVANVDLPGASWVTQSQTAGSDPSTETVTATCPAGQRLITGGEHIDSINGYSKRSYPVEPQAWTADGAVPAHDTLSVSVLCGPAGDPVADFTSGPRGSTNFTDATFTFTAVDPSAVSSVSNYCFLNTNYLGVCSGSYTVTGLAEGQNVFSIEAFTDDGRGGASTEKDYYFWVDLTPPTVTLAKQPGFALGKIVNLRASGTDNQGIGYYHVLVTARRAAGTGAGTANPVVTSYNTGSGLLSVPVKAGISYRFDVTAIDYASNVSSVFSISTAVPLDNASLTASDQWSLINNAVYTNFIVSRTKAKGATLTHSMYGKTLGIVATTCPTCGQVGIYAGTTLLKTIDLAATSTHYRQVFKVYLGNSPVQVPVVLKVLSTNKLVEIDGLGALVS